MVWGVGVVLVLQVAIDQILWNPIFGTMFFTYMGLAEGQDLEGIKTRLKNDLLTSVSTSSRQAAQERSTAGAPGFRLQLLSFGKRLTRAVPAAVCPSLPPINPQVKGSWTVWPVAHAINFRFIPNSQRLLYINTVQVGGQAGREGRTRAGSLSGRGLRWWLTWLAVGGATGVLQLLPEPAGQQGRQEGRARGRGRQEVKEQQQHTSLHHP